ncbi:MAG: hypothetical protein Q9222_003347 [Ikaeria aurantiellina]
MEVDAHVDVIGTATRPLFRYGIVPKDFRTNLFARHSLWSYHHDIEKLNLHTQARIGDAVKVAQRGIKEADLIVVAWMRLLRRQHDWFDGLHRIVGEVDYCRETSIYFEHPHPELEIA